MKNKPGTHFECCTRQTPIAIIQSHHLQFDSLQPNTTGDTITITLKKTVPSAAQPTKNKSYKLMRIAASHEKLMWQVVTVPAKLSDAFGSLLRYAQDSFNIFFCPT